MDVRPLILVVDDNPHVSKMVAEFLKLYGYEVEIAPDAGLALEKLQTTERSIDLLLTDIQMPGMSGIDLAAKITQASPQTRVLFMTGYAEEVDLTALRWPLITKPFLLQVLLSAVREQIPQKTPPAPPPENTSDS